MAESAAATAKTLATAKQYNDLRNDTLSTTLGHMHDGTNARVHTDDTIFALGTDKDIGQVLRSTALAANTVLAGVIEGTAATLAVAANSLLIGNITNDGDVGIYVSKAGNTHTAFLADGSTGDTILNAATGQSVDLYVAGAKEYDFSATTFDINGNTITNTGVLTLPTSTDTLVGRATTDTLTNKTLSAPTFSGAYSFGGTPTFGATMAGASTFSGVITLSATAAFTNASPFSIANGQTLTVSVTAQTVGAATLTVPNFAGVADTFAFITLAQTLSNKTLSAPTFSGAYSLGGTPTFGATMAGASTFSGAITLSATAAFTNASPFSVANGQTLTVSTTAQTVGAATLTVPNFAGVADTFAFITLAQTLSNKTLSAPTFSGAYSFGGTPTFGATMAGASSFSGAITLTAIGTALTVNANARVESLGIGVAPSATAGRLLVNSEAGGHQFGTIAAANTYITFNPVFTAAAGNTGIGLDLQGTITLAAGESGFGVELQPIFVESAGAGTHGIIAALRVLTRVTAGTGNVTDFVGIDIRAGTAQLTTTNATGLRVAAPTGATNNYAINVTSGDIFKAGTAYTNPAYVLEHWVTGRIVQFANRDGASDYPGLQTLSWVKEFAREHYELPLMTLKPKGGLFDRGDLLLASVEESYIYLFSHEERIEYLERENKALRQELVILQGG